MREGRSSATGSQKGRRGGKVRKRGYEVPLGAAKRSEKKEAGGRQGRGYVVVKLSEAAKAAGMPKSLMVTGPAVGGRALRACRSCHERRVCARCARERITSPLGGETAGGDRLISRRWCRTSCMQARRCSLRFQSRQSRAAGPSRSGSSRTLTCRGFAVALPFH